jgi:hypothetical protein
MEVAKPFMHADDFDNRVPMGLFRKAIFHGFFFARFLILGSPWGKSFIAGQRIPTPVSSIPFE